MNNSSSATHKSHTQHSTTLNRKYVKQPASRIAASRAVTSTATRSAAAARLAAERSAAAARTAAAAMKSDTMKRRQALAEQMNRERLKSMSTTKSRVASTATSSTPAKPKPDPTSEPKVTKSDRAAESAIRAVATMGENTSSLKPSRTFTFKRIALALLCSALIVIPLAFFITQNVSEFPPSASATQIGFKPSYPTYTPRGYNRSSVVAEEGKISITFTDAEGSSYTLTEELSSWDSDTLERNDVKDTFSDYSIITEGGLTLFVSGSDCMWVSGGKKYYIDVTSGSLTKKQLKSIAASL